MKQFIKITLVLFLAFIAGCYYDTEERLYPKIHNPCDDVNVTFSNTVTTILHPCQQCHSNSNAPSQSGIRLQDIADVVSIAKTGNKLMGSLNQTQGFVRMPPVGKLPDCEIQQLQKWIDANYPNN